MTRAWGIDRVKGFNRQMAAMAYKPQRDTKRGYGEWHAHEGSDDKTLPTSTDKGCEQRPG